MIHHYKREFFSSSDEKLTILRLINLIICGLCMAAGLMQHQGTIGNAVLIALAVMNFALFVRPLMKEESHEMTTGHKEPIRGTTDHAQ